MGICKLTLTPPAPDVLLHTYRLLVKCLVSCVKFVWVILGQLFQFSNPAFAKGSLKFQKFCMSISGGPQTLQKIASDPIVRKLFPFQLPFNTSEGLQNK